MIPELAELYTAVLKTDAGSDESEAKVNPLNASKRAAEIARMIPPELLEAEIRCQLHEARKNLDNVVDLLAASALQKKSGFLAAQEFAADDGPSALYSPRITYREESRSFSIKWRRYTFNKLGRHVLTEHVSTKDGGQGQNYSLHVFRSVKSPEHRALIAGTEKDFALLRDSLTSLQNCRREINRMDSTVTAFFDHNPGIDPDSRITSSRLDGWPLDEEKNAKTYVLETEVLREAVDKTLGKAK